MTSLPLYRVAFDATTLLREHPPRFKHTHKSALFEMAYPDEPPSSIEIEVTRWAARVDNPLVFLDSSRVEIQPNYNDYRPVGDPATSLEWHVNFADPQLFVAYGSALFAHDEMQVAEHPILGSVREAILARGLAALTQEAGQPTPVLVRNVERRIAVATDINAAQGRPRGLYGNRFAEAPLDVVRRATQRIDPPTLSQIIAIAAPCGGRGDYTLGQIERILMTAITAFASARSETFRSRGESCETVIHTGFWGCGAFGGNRKLMVAVQRLASRAAGVGTLVFHTADEAGAAETQTALDVAQAIALRCGASCSLRTLAGHLEMLGYRWGVSDGN